MVNLIRQTIIILFPLTTLKAFRHKQALQVKDHNTGRICAASKIYTPLRVMGVIVLSSQSKRVTMVLTTAVDNWESYKPGQKNLVTFNDVIGMKLTDLEL